MALRLLLARHAQSEWNRLSRLQGQTNTRLDEAGERQALALGTRLASEPIDAAYASDLERTWRTAELALAGRPIAVQRDPVWRELSFGEWEGLTHDEVSRRDPDLAERRLRDPEHVAPPGGETLADLARRITPTIDSLRAHHDGQTVLLVTHGGVLRVLACLALGTPLNHAWRLQTNNCGLSCLRWYDEFPVVELWNDTLHLAPLQPHPR